MEEENDREINPAQLEHTRPTPRSEVYLDASGGNCVPVWRHWTHFLGVPKRILQWCLRIQPIAQGRGHLNLSTGGQHTNPRLQQL